MGRMLGAFADDQELDRPDLNKCPDCNCFFAGEACPLCGKICPENMRAGNRAPVKKRKRRGGSDSGRVKFVEWYHSWWFIAIMILTFPIVGMVLLVTSPYKTSRKALFIALAVAYLILSTIGIGSIVSGLTDMLDDPVNDTISKEEYIARCALVTPEDICRSADGYNDKFVPVKLKIVKKVTYQDEYYNSKDYVCYLCEAENGSTYNLILRDCLLENQQRFIAGDIITVYGECAGECTAFDSEYNEYVAPCLNMAYVTLN
jgi:hypothetical protein